MKERPILFNDPMVRAILNGKKMQTRRLVKYNSDLGEPENWGHKRNKHSLIGDYRRYCHLGTPGDRLWVRETHALLYLNHWPDLPHTFGPAVSPDECPEHVVYYRASFDRSSTGFQWRPSIHMPRWASRISLEITGVRVERLQDITVKDALSEGIDHNPMNCPRMEFAQLWNSIYEKDGNGWTVDPWVWTIEFKKVGTK